MTTVSFQGEKNHFQVLDDTKGVDDQYLPSFPHISRADQSFYPFSNRPGKMIVLSAWSYQLLAQGFKIETLEGTHI